MDLAVLPDGRVLHAERSGEVSLHDGATGLKTLAARLDVYEHDEEGLQGIAIDANFEENGWVYLYYTAADHPVDDPATPTVNEGDAPELGGFRPLRGMHPAVAVPMGRNTIALDSDSEQRFLEVPVDRPRRP